MRLNSLTIPVCTATFLILGGCVKKPETATASLPSDVLGGVDGVAPADLPSAGVVTFRAGEGYTDVPLSLPGDLAVQVIGRRPVITNSSGRTLYSLENDVPESEKNRWQPALVRAGALASGDWSVVAGPDGSQQWAYQGKRLYTFAEDSQAGDAKGEKQLSGAGAGGRLGGLTGSQPNNQTTPQPETRGTAVVLGAPSGIVLPAGIQTREVVDVGGIGLADVNGKTIYFRQDGKGSDCRANCQWLAVRAPAEAKGQGDFSSITRPGGIQQWSYKGKLLYTFVGDELPGDARGAVLNGEWRVALVERHFFPSGVEIRNVLGVGTVLALDGKTLYQRDIYYGQFGGRTVRRGFLIAAESGRLVGTRGCNADCEQEWLPFLAPADAQPGGYWNVLERIDGKKQWSYKGYAMYTYKGDEQPGDVNGNPTVDIYDLASSKPGPYVDLLKEGVALSANAKARLSPNYTSALQWSATYP